MTFGNIIAFILILPCVGAPILLFRTDAGDTTCLHSLLWAHKYGERCWLAET